MKSQAELKSVHDLLCLIVSGYYPIKFRPQDQRVLEAQYHVLCFALECEGNDCFKGTINSLKDLIGRVKFQEHGRQFKSWALVE